MKICPLRNSLGLRQVSKSVLYISYDGLLEPLGESQVLAYIEQLARHRPIHLISFEKANDWRDVHARARIAARLGAAGIHWHPLRYHKQPSTLATAWDILVGTLLALVFVLRTGIEIVHARSYVAGVMAWLATRATGAKFLFDMRGFWVDERVDGGLWPSGGRTYRVAKWFERRLLRSADHVVSLTNAGVRELRAFECLAGRMPRMTVIPTCADLERFKLGPRGTEAGFVLGYVGSAGTWYLFDATVACFVCLRKLCPDARLLIINRGEHDYIRQRLGVAGVPAHLVELRSTRHEEIPAQMARMHATAFFIKPVFSKQASAPTKLAEFLGCGVPCLTNIGVGDVAEVLETDRVGVTVEGFTPEELTVGVERLLRLRQEPGIERRCADAARKHFSLAEGVFRYAKIYRELETVK